MADIVHFGRLWMGTEAYIVTLLRTALFFVIYMAAIPGAARADRHLPTLPVAEISDDGMYAQNWLYKSVFDLQKDLTATAKEGKRLVIFWEQSDCFVCKPMYDINLRIPRIIEKIRTNFNVIKLNIAGERKITDLDGKAMSEKDLAAKYEIYYTPTLQFLPESLEKAMAQPATEPEVFRSEGYFKPYHFYFMFHYVQSRGYETQPSFQRWLGDIGKEHQAKGIRYDLWADSLPPDLPDKY
jgi:thioredoxin-related protein